jgi:hypothetical protein
MGSCLFRPRLWLKHYAIGAKQRCCDWNGGNIKFDGYDYMRKVFGIRQLEKG